MRLIDLLPATGCRIEGNADADITGLTADSRAVRPGMLFAALPGVKADGATFIPAALASGASAILLPEGVFFENTNRIGIIKSDNCRKALAEISSKFYQRQPAQIVAVTGTNGKTSVAHFTRQIWQALGVKAASLGTIGLHGDGIDRSGSMTTPDPVTLHADLAELAGAGIDHLAMEASSHGLKQNRLDGVTVQAAGFTNLTRDHLDYHPDMADYLAAKAMLFAERLAPNGVAVLNADVQEFAQLSEICQKRGIRVLSYGHAGADLTLRARTPRPGGQDMELAVLGRSAAVTLPLVGEFQAMNALCALGLAISEYLDQPELIEKSIAALATLKGAPGRLERIPGHPEGAEVYVDYAHTPDGLETVLKALRPHVGASLWCLFGCGGDRDPGKRPMMGRIAADLADRVVITDDNPRSEDPASIRAAIRAAAPSADEIADRAAAITETISRLTTGDVLVIAGKGHEQGQILADRTVPFSDVTVANTAISLLKERISCHGRSARTVDG